MKILYTKQEVIEVVQTIKRKGEKIAFVPTMGFLHEGHISLFQKAAEYSTTVFASIFVNPTQFNNKEDFEKYPKNTEADIQKAKEAGVSYLFLPSPEEIYPQEGYSLEIRIPHLMKGLCAKTRPGHFEGVLWIISKLFHLVQPDYAIFGRKDYQQYLIIKEFVFLTDMNTLVIGMDTVREPDGLAMSSRNARLTEKERKNATFIPRAFDLAEKQIIHGEKRAKAIRDIIAEVLLSSPLAKLDYVEVVDPNTLEPLETIDKTVLIAVAVYMGNIRLIDNWLVEV
jgi:pantoate--beta-alanine ligase